MRYRVIAAFDDSGGWKPGDPNLKTSVRNLLSQDSLLIDVRVTRRKVEVDLKTGSPGADLSRLSKALGRMLWYRVVDPGAEPRDPIADALRYYREERVWEAHEALEAAWRRATGLERRILHGLIQAMAAMVHWQRGSRSKTLEERALKLLEAAPDNWMNWPIGEIKSRLLRGPESY